MQRSIRAILVQHEGCYSQPASPNSWEKLIAAPNSAWPFCFATRLMVSGARALVSPGKSSFFWQRPINAICVSLLEKFVEHVSSAICASAFNLVPRAWVGAGGFVRPGSTDASWGFLQ